MSSFFIRLDFVVGMAFQIRHSCYCRMWTDVFSVPGFSHEWMGKYIGEVAKKILPLGAMQKTTSRAVSPKFSRVLIPARGARGTLFGVCFELMPIITIGPERIYP